MNNIFENISLTLTLLKIFDIYLCHYFATNKKIAISHLWHAIELVISTGTRISGYPNPEYLPESEISYPNLSLFLSISPTLADQVQTYLDFINSLKNKTIQLKCTIILFSHPCTPFLYFICLLFWLFIHCQILEPFENRQYIDTVT